jgi:hypothetical protein
MPWQALLLAMTLVLLVKLVVNLRLYTLIWRQTLGDDMVLPPLRGGRQLVLLVRVLAEESHVARCIRAHQYILRECDNTLLVFAGSDAELDDDGSHPTLCAVETFLKSNEAAGIQDRVLFFQAPRKAGVGIAFQSNHAIEQLSTYFPDDSKIWVKTLDIDTVLSRANLIELSDAVNDDKEVIEIPAAYFANYHRLGLAQKLHAIYQDRWSVVSEQFLGRLKNRFHLVYSNSSGAGCCINVRRLRELGMFPTETDIEDIHLSFLINATGGDIHTTKSRVSSDVPSTLRQGLKQEYEWSFGALDVPYYFANLRRSHAARIRNTHMVSAIVTTAWLNAKWALFSVAYVASIAVSVFVYAPAAVLPAVVTVDFVIYGFIVNRQLNMSWRTQLATTVAMPLQIFRISLPCLAAVTTRVTLIRRRKREGVYKTQH